MVQISAGNVLPYRIYGVMKELVGRLLRLFLLQEMQSSERFSIKLNTYVQLLSEKNFGFRIHSFFIRTLRHNCEIILHSAMQCVISTILDTGTKYKKPITIKVACDFEFESKRLWLHLDKLWRSSHSPHENLRPERNKFLKKFTGKPQKRSQKISGKETTQEYKHTRVE